MENCEPILVVSDDPLVLELLGLILAELDHPIVLADVQSCPRGNVSPSLLVLDLDVSNSDGEEHLRAIRERMPLGVPVLVMSISEAITRRAHEMKADAWFCKPFDVDRLLASARRLLRSA